MAVFQAARWRAGPPAADPLGALSGTLRTRRVRSAPRLRPAGLLIGAILAATMLGVLYLTQTLASNATSSQIADLGSRREELVRQLRNQALAVETRADPSEIGRRARGRGLIELEGALILPVP